MVSSTYFGVRDIAIDESKACKLLRASNGVLCHLHDAPSKTSVRRVPGSTIWLMVCHVAIVAADDPARPSGDGEGDVCSRIYDRSTGAVHDSRPKERSVMAIEQ